MTAHRKDPYRKVIQSILQDDGILGRWWMLDLECGHDDIRRVKYARRAGLTWGGSRHSGPLRPIKDAAPAPVNVMCEECGLRGLTNHTTVPKTEAGEGE